MKIQKKTFYNSILGFFVKDGKKGKAKSLLDETFAIVRKKTKRSLSVTMTLFFFRLKTLVEVKKLSTRKRSYSVPFIISSKRRVYLIFK
jgi:ribosomal protein S7